jgi:hypothetical protein
LTLIYKSELKRTKSSAKPKERWGFCYQNQKRDGVFVIKTKREMGTKVMKPGNLVWLTL